jgi:hypothetical protein
MELWAEANERLLRKWLKLPNGIPSHDTIERVKYIEDARYREEMGKSESETVCVMRLFWAVCR